MAANGIGLLISNCSNPCACSGGGGTRYAWSIGPGTSFIQPYQHCFCPLPIGTPYATGTIYPGVDVLITSLSCVSAEYGPAGDVYQYATAGFCLVSITEGLYGPTIWSSGEIPFTFDDSGNGTAPPPAEIIISDYFGYDALGVDMVFAITAQQTIDENGPGVSGVAYCSCTAGPTIGGGIL